MFKFVILSVILAAACVIAQDAENYEVCADLDDETQVGVGYDISCTKYYFCSGGVGILEDCTEIYNDADLAFNEETGACEYDVQCGDNGGVDPNYPEYPEPDPETNPPPVVVVTTTQPPAVVTQTTTTSRPGVVEDVTCPTNRPGEIIFFPSSNCSQYFICASGVRLQMSCIDGFMWNEDDNQCDYPIFSRCASRESGISDDGMNVRCNRRGQYVTAYPRDCSKYVFCLEGIPHLQNCPVGHAWNHNHCVDRRYAQCPDLSRQIRIF